MLAARALMIWPIPITFFVECLKPYTEHYTAVSMNLTFLSENEQETYQYKNYN